MPAMENLKTINSTIRTLLAAGVVGVGGYAAYLGYNHYNADEIEAQKTAKQLESYEKDLADAKKTLETKDAELKKRANELIKKQEEIAERDATILAKDSEIEEHLITIDEQGEEINHLETAMRLLKVKHRLARLTVVEQEEDPETGLYTVVEFTEVNDAGDAIEEPRTFRIQGDVVFVDSWVVKFEDKYIEEADIDRATSLILFRRIFGESQKPEDGYALDRPGTRPTAYARGTKMSEFEAKIWGDFWSIANDSARSEELGIDAAHGDAVSMQVKKNKSYSIEARSTGNISFVPNDSPPMPKKLPQPTS